jgi:hypothetical protein
MDGRGREAEGGGLNTQTCREQNLWSSWTYVKLVSRSVLPRRVSFTFNNHKHGRLPNSLSCVLPASLFPGKQLLLCHRYISQYSEQSYTDFRNAPYCVDSSFEWGSNLWGKRICKWTGVLELYSAIFNNNAANWTVINTALPWKIESCVAAGLKLRCRI